MTRAAWLPFVLVAACANPDGDVTVTNDYTGPCSITFKVGEEVDTYDDLAAGASATTSVEPGRVIVGFKTLGMQCGRTCEFADGSTFNEASCNVYAAGGGFDATVEVVDQAASCPTGESIIQPKLVCSGAAP